MQARKLSVDGAPIGSPVGAVPCAAPDQVGLAGGTVGSSAALQSPQAMAEVSAAKQIWTAVAVVGDNGTVQLRNSFYSARSGGTTAHPVPGAGRCLSLQPPNPIAYNPPYRHPTRPHPRPIWSAEWQAVLLPCNATDSLQLWRFAAPGQYPSELADGHAQRTLGALLNVGAPAAQGAAAAAAAATWPPNATNGSAIALSLLPETDPRYGVNHIGGARLQYPDVEVACTTRGCAKYQPSQMWYLGRDGLLQSGNYTASINEQWLTAMVPAPSRRCLSAVHSADMAGTPAGETEVWGGPLANGSIVLALCNRDAPNGTSVSAPLSLLLGHNQFFSFAMLAERSARASGYATSVDSRLAGGRWLGMSFSVRDVLTGQEMSDVKPGGVMSAEVDTGDTRLLLLTPIPQS